MTQLSRRRFFQLTLACAGTITVPVAVVSAAPAKTILGDPIDPPAPTPWVPSEAEVAEWLQYYKWSVQKRFEEVTHVMQTNPENFQGSHLTEIEHTLVRDGDVLSVVEVKQFEEAFGALEADRAAVGSAQGWGYEAGRAGAPRVRVSAHGPSNANFAWYNGWDTGEFDRVARFRLTSRGNKTRMTREEYVNDLLMRA
jgi:hypothetical protein